jgi:hypothetical protein
MLLTLVRPTDTELQAAVMVNPDLIEAQGERVQLADLTEDYLGFAMEAIDDECRVEGTFVWIPGVPFKGLFPTGGVLDDNEK